MEPSEVEPEGWGDNAIKVTLTYVQRREQEITKMSLSTQRHCNLYKYEEIIHMHQEVHGAMEIISIDRGFVWPIYFTLIPSQS
jgi:hypothetical protein